MDIKKKEFISQSFPSLFLLGIGGFIYILFRPKTLLMFCWFDAIGMNGYINRLRDSVTHITLNQTTLYCIPNGLWIASYILMVNAIVSKQNKNNLLFWSFLLPTLAVLFELLQIVNLIPGVFDVFDLICYIIPLFIYLIYLKYEKFI